MFRQVILAVIAISGIVACSGKRSAGESEIPGIREGINNTDHKAKIFIDKNGLPYVEAENAEDGMFAIGYITARMRYAEIDILRVVSNGIVSSLLDIEQANSVDSLTIRTLIDIKTGKLVTQKQWELLQEKDPKSAKLFQAFVDGINFYIKRLEEGKEELPPEYEAIFAPRNPQKNKGKFYITPPEILAIARFEEWYLTGEGDLEFSLIRERIKEKTEKEIYNRIFSEIMTARAGVDIFTLPAPKLKEDYSIIFFQLDFFKGAKFGSNNFVISPKIASKPIVANDPHLPLLNPSLWFPIRAKIGDLYFEGFALIGIPGILSGTNGSVAWAVTNGGYDSLDVYLEKIKREVNCPSGFSFEHNPQDSRDDSCVEHTEYKIGKDQKKFFYCKTHGTILGTKLDVLNGNIKPEPNLEDGTEYISFRWTGHEVSSEVLYFLKLLEAETVDEFMKAITGFEVATINFVFADLRGNIGFGDFNLLPKRDWDTRKFPPVELLPTDGCCDWKSWEPREKFPNTKNPEKGFIVTANNDLPGYTKDGDPFNDPIYLFWSYDPGYRVSEITYMIQEKAKQTGNKISEKEVQEIMEDTVSYWTRGVFPKVITYFENFSGDQTENSALSLLKNWDMSCKSGFKLDNPADLNFSEVQESEKRKNSSGCTIWWIFVSRLIMNTFSDEFLIYTQKKPSTFLEDYFIKNLYFYFVYNKREPNFFDNVSTPAVETDRDIIFLSFKEAVKYLSENFGKNPENWLWGKLNKMKLYHPTSQAGISLFDIGPFPIDLGPFAPAVSWIYLVTDDPKSSFINTGGPSFRSISTPQGDRFKLTFAFPGGVAGFGWDGNEKTLKKPDFENFFNNLISSYFGNGYIEFEEDKTKHKKVILIEP